MSVASAFSTCIRCAAVGGRQAGMGATGRVMCKADSSVVVPVHEHSHCSFLGRFKCTKSSCSDGDLLVSVDCQSLPAFARAASHTFMMELGRPVLAL